MRRNSYHPFVERPKGNFTVSCCVCVCFFCLLLLCLCLCSLLLLTSLTSIPVREKLGHTLLNIAARLFCNKTFSTFLENYCSCVGSPRSILPFLDPDGWVDPRGLNRQKDPGSENHVVLPQACYWAGKLPVPEPQGLTTMKSSLPRNVRLRRVANLDASPSSLCSASAKVPCNPHSLRSAQMKNVDTSKSWSDTSWPEPSPLQTCHDQHGRARKQGGQKPLLLLQVGCSKAPTAPHTWNTSKLQSCTFGWPLYSEARINES